MTDKERYDDPQPTNPQEDKAVKEVVKDAWKQEKESEADTNNE